MAYVWDKAFFEQVYSSDGWPFGVRGIDWSLYRIPNFHYTWFGQKPRVQNDFEKLLQAPGFAQLTHVAILGGGFGWLGELLVANGINVANVETSAFVVNNAALSEESDLRSYVLNAGMNPDSLPCTFMSPEQPDVELAPGAVWSYWLRPDGKRTSVDIVAEDVSTTTGRNNVKSYLSNNLDGIVTDHLLDSCETEAEALGIADSAELLRPNPAVPVVHLMEPSTPSFPTNPLFVGKTFEEWAAFLVAGGFGQHWLVDPTGRYSRADQV